ncbi:MAG: TetR/AcrR family transcriptional regulator [Peptococcaceae bacterium]|nr:TetR/AcrR family transcriptional regulator [Peptococcaceae bacterium]
MTIDIRERVLNSMEELAYRKGLIAATMDELAAAAGISKRTLYRYFDSKEKVIEGVVHRLTGRIERDVDAVVDSDLPPPEKLRRIVALIYENIRFIDAIAFQELQKHYPHIWAYIDKFRAARIGRFKKILEEGIQSGYFKAVNPQLTITALLAAVRAIINPDFITRHALSLDDAFKELFNLFFNGISRK